MSASFPARSASPALLPGVELLSRRDVTMSKTKFFPGFHAEVQAHTRLERSTPDLERDHAEVKQLNFSVIDAAPLPICTSPGSGCG